VLTVLSLFPPVVDTRVDCGGETDCGLFSRDGARSLITAASGLEAPQLSHEELRITLLYIKSAPLSEINIFPSDFELKR